MSAGIWTLMPSNESYREFIREYQADFERDSRIEEETEGLSPEHAFRQ